MCLLCSICLMITGTVLWKETRCYDNYVTIVNTDGGYEEDVCNELEEKQQWLEREKLMSYTLWGEKQGVFVSDGENLRQTSTTVLTIRGSSEHLLPYGKILQKEDKSGCLIGRKTAWQLFGTYHVENLYVQYEKQIFQVRGVLNEPEDILVIQKQSSIDTILDRITVKKQSGRSVPETVSDFTGRYGVSGEVIRFDFYGGLSWVFELIPGKWSDFSGWKQNISSVKKQWGVLESAEKSTMEIMFLRHTKKAVICFMISWVLGSLAVGIVFRGHNRRQNSKISLRPHTVEKECDIIGTSITK